MNERLKHRSTYADAAYELLDHPGRMGQIVARLLNRWTRNGSMPASVLGTPKVELLEGFLQRMEPNESDTLSIPFERGLDLVLHDLKLIKDGQETPWGRPVLLILGGGKAGVRAAGQVVALQEAGLGGIFDVVGISVGSFIGAYFLCNIKSAAWGTTLFSQEANSPAFHSRLGTRMNLDYLISRMREGRKRIDFGSIQAGQPGFFVLVTRTDGSIAIVDMKRQSPEDFFAYMKASASLPFIHGKTVVNGRELWDGGIVDPLPIKAILSMFGHGKRPILVLANGPYSPPHASGATGLERGVAVGLSMAGMDIHAAAAARLESYAKNLEWIRRNPAFPIGMMFSPPDRLNVLSKDANQLRAAGYAAHIDALIRLHRAGLLDSPAT